MSQYPIAIITDSTCDIPKDLIDQYKICVLPHTLIWGNEQLRDRVDIAPEDFYNRLQSDTIRPTTSQVSSKQFADAYQDAQKQGAAEILVMTVANTFSGAFQSARQAVEAVNIPVHVIDSCSVTMGMGWQLLAAARVREAEGSIQAMLETINDVRKKLALTVGMDSVMYLAKTGRFGNAAKMIASLLNIKPMVWVNPENGVVEPGGISRTYKNLVDMMYQKFFELIGTGKKLHIAVCHGNVYDEAKKVIDRIVEEHKPVEILTNITSPVLGLNTGPRALAISGYWEEPEAA
jgi:DegV family protein with EDD domain